MLVCKCGTVLREYGLDEKRKEETIICSNCGRVHHILAGPSFCKSLEEIFDKYNGAWKRLAEM